MQPSSYRRLSLLFASLGLICQLSFGLPPEITEDNAFSPKTGCRQDFMEREGSCYQVFSKKLTWDEAEDFCSTFEPNGHLVSIQDVTELHSLAKVLKKTKNHRVWVGLSDLDKDGKWEWTDSSAVTFIPWAENPGIRPCVSLFRIDGYMLFRPQRCTVKHAYICEHEPRFEPD